MKAIKQSSSTKYDKASASIQFIIVVDADVFHFFNSDFTYMFTLVMMSDKEMEAGMNINHIETFIRIVKLKSFHKAADTLFLSQPTVSARIKSLERELNTELFARRGKGLLLTEQGKRFLPYAEQIIQMVEEGKQQMKERDEQEEIVIGANFIASQYFIPFALPVWRQLNPQLRFKFVAASNEVLIEKILQKKIDLAFTKDMTISKVQSHQILDNPLKLIAYNSHPLQSEEKVTIPRLGAEVMVFHEWETSEWIQIRNLFEIANVEPKIEFQVNHLEVAKSIIKNGHAIGFLPYLSVKEELTNGELVEIDIAHLTEIEEHVFLTYVNPAISKWRFLEGVEESIKLFNKANDSRF